jgi:hypothetical protein
VAYCQTGVAVKDHRREAGGLVAKIGEVAAAAPLSGVEAAGEAAQISEHLDRQRKSFFFFIFNS